jgi:hypothetical protein
MRTEGVLIYVESFLTFLVFLLETRITSKVVLRSSDFALSYATVISFPS